MATELEKLGVAPGGDDGSYFQKLEILNARRSENTFQVTVGGDADAEILRFGKDYLAGGHFLESSGVTAPVVFVGHGIHAPALDHDDYEGVPEVVRADTQASTLVDTKRDEGKRLGAYELPSFAPRKARGRCQRSLTIRRTLLSANSEGS